MPLLVKLLSANLPFSLPSLSLCLSLICRWSSSCNTKPRTGHPHPLARTHIHTYKLTHAFHHPQKHTPTLSQVLHRNELSGTLTGLTRVRRFQQDDAHLFVRRDQIEAENKACLDFVQFVYTTFGFTMYFNLSTRNPETQRRSLSLCVCVSVCVWLLLTPHFF